MPAVAWTRCGVKLIKLISLTQPSCVSPAARWPAGVRVSRFSRGTPGVEVACPWDAQSPRDSLYAPEGCMAATDDPRREAAPLQE